MKRITGMLVAAMIVAIVAVGCGSSSDSTNSGTTPSATSTTTMTAMNNAGLWMSESIAVIPGALPATGASIKVSESTISCTGTVAGFDCVIWDALGSATSTDHMCDITGSYDQTLHSFDLAYDCYTYEPASGVLVDGNWTARITINFATTATAKALGLTKEDTVSSCDVEDVANACGETFTFEDGSCTATCDGPAACTEAAAMSTVEWTVGSRGINMMDACGNYDIAAGTSSLMTFCAPSNTNFIISSTVNGTINGTVIDENIDIDCTVNF